MIRFSILSIAVLASLASMQANASFTYRTTLDANVVFVQPQSGESMCEASTRYIANYTQSLSLDVAVTGRYRDFKCYMDINNIYAFSSKDQLIKVANYTKTLNSGDYSIQLDVYGFAENTGRALLLDGRVYDEIWNEI